MTTKQPLPSAFLPLHTSGASLETVGGKALNLAILAEAGFNVPKGFFIPTACYHDFVRHNQLMPRVQATLQDLDPKSPTGLETASHQIRSWFAEGSLPPGTLSDLEIGWRWLGTGPVAVRSSATAEDLPGLSFAGLQDTYLNRRNLNAIEEAVVGCWASLWTARAISYRARNHIPPQAIAMCVIIQKMVQPTASGVLFTANPLTGLRTETVIEATLGLGEVLVSGQIEPDHYVVGPQGGIRHKHLGSKSVGHLGRKESGIDIKPVEACDQQAIPDTIIRTLAAIGQKIAALYNTPQDIEWAYEAPSLEAGDKGAIYILQSRPITTLFPLPEGVPPEPIQGWFGLHAVQGLVDPMTPLGQQALMMVLTGAGQLLKMNHTLETQTAFYSCAERLWINFTPFLHSPIGHRLFPTLIQMIDPGVAAAAKELAQDPRFAPSSHLPRPITVRRLTRFLFPILVRVARTLRHPDRTREEIFQAFEAKIDEAQQAQAASNDMWANYDQHLAQLLAGKTLFSDFVIPQLVPLVVAGMASLFGILQRFSRQAARTLDDESLSSLYLEITRGLPNNVTTEMDLHLWHTAKTLVADCESARIFNTSQASDLADAYLEGSLPPTAQSSLDDFLSLYGTRGLGEIDLGRERWQENPTHICQVLQSYLKIDDPAMAPDQIFEGGAQAAKVATERLLAAVRQLPGGFFKARLVRFGIQRYRALGGMREAPKFFAIRMMALIRQGLLASGINFVAAGLLEQPDDLFFLKIVELEQIAQAQVITPEMRDRIRERREVYHTEMRRTNLPRVILSDGRAYYDGYAPAGGDPTTLAGDPVSPGLVTGYVRVVLDPLNTQLQPGEILVCPATDPAWTPLFLAAAGLVMEIGGMMTHGSVVAREYGLPAVVGVTQATTRLVTGQRIILNGNTGHIEILAG